MKSLLPILTLFIAGVAQASPDTVPRAVTESGAVVGVAGDRGVLAFKGIPYAAPPVGTLRWRPPQDAPHWNQPREAAAYGPACWGSPIPGVPGGPPQSEDCLTLNVWTPEIGASGDASTKRPVMVWIHGGGFQFGSSAMPGTDGTALAAKGVVVVSFNYRLGSLGFLAHPELDREGPASGDYGLQDQIAALQWVRRNIAAFGGDPDNVTVFGESAGAHAIGLLMASPVATGLFDMAIAESGAFWDSEHGSLATHEEALARGVDLQARLHAGDMNALRAVPAEEVNAAGRWDFRLDPGTTAFSPSVDGHVLKDSPAAVFERGEQARIPLLAGWNALEEAPLFIPRALPHESPEAFRQAASVLFGRDRMDAFQAVYPPAQLRSAETLIGDLVISQQTWKMLGSQQAAKPDAVYAYHFSFASPYSPIANHSAEIKYVFGNLDPSRQSGLGPSEDDRRAADLMMSYWTNFAIQGNPNAVGLPVWPLYAGPGSKVLDIGPASATAVTEIGTERFRFIEAARRAGRLPEVWRSAISVTASH